MATEKYTNPGAITLSGSIGTGDTSFTLAGAYNTLPSAGNFRIRIDDELMIVGSISGATVSSVTRGAESSTAASHTSGVDVFHVVTAGSLDAMRSDDAYTNTQANRLTAEKDGRLFLPSNGVTLQRDTGAAWAHFGPLRQCEPSVALSALAWINQGGASADETRGPIHISAPAAASPSLRILKKSTAAGDWTIEACLLPTVIAGSHPRAGILFRESGTSELLTWGILMAFNVPYLVVDRWNSESSYASEQGKFTPHPGSFGMGVWIRMRRASGVLYTDFSGDGFNWINYLSEAVGAFLTPDEVGIFADANNASYGLELLFPHLKHT